MDILTKTEKQDLVYGLEGEVDLGVIDAVESAILTKLRSAEPVGIVQAVSVCGTPMQDSRGVDWLESIPVGSKLYTHPAPSEGDSLRSFYIKDMEDTLRAIAAAADMDPQKPDADALIEHVRSLVRRSSEGDRRDAERYRWIRAGHDCNLILRDSNGKPASQSDEPEWWILDGIALESAIDAAMSKEQGNG